MSNIWMKHKRGSLLSPGATRNDWALCLPAWWFLTPCVTRSDSLVFPCRDKKKMKYLILPIPEQFQLFSVSFLR